MYPCKYIAVKSSVNKTRHRFLFFYVVYVSKSNHYRFYLEKNTVKTRKFERLSYDGFVDKDLRFLYFFLRNL